jgi:hypothetical protein
MLLARQQIQSGTEADFGVGIGAGSAVPVREVDAKEVERRFEGRSEIQVETSAKTTWE